MVEARKYYQAWTDFAVEIAHEAGKIAHNYFRSDIAFQRKGDNSPVTKADQEIEQFLRQKIERKYPDHGIIGEEFGITKPNASVQWVIDPIDGTKAFLAGLPLFGILIGIFVEGQAIGGVIYQPISKECWHGSKGDYGHLNGKSIHTNQNQLLADAILCTTAPRIMAKSPEKERFEALREQVYFTRYGLDCYAAGMLASGYIDFMIEAKLQIYDYAALIAVIEASGGVVSNWKGEPLTLDSPKTNNPRGHFLAAGNKTLHAQALEYLQINF